MRAIELVLDEVNAAGGVNGRRVELSVHDDANDPERAVALAQELADDSRTIAVIGHNTSACSIAAGQVYAETGLPAVSSAATSNSVTAGNPWYFRVIFDDRAQGRFVMAYVREALGFTSST